MDARLLRSFVAVAEELHFGRAAQRLHLSQPPLSMQIKKLEDDLGVRLFERSNRKVELTEAGAALYGRARHLLAEAERAREEVVRIARGLGGVLAIAYTPTATYELLPRAVPRFRRAFPDVRLELIELRSPLVPDAIRAGRVELGLVCGPIDTGGLAVRTLVRERPAVVLPARHPLTARRRIHVSRLHGEPFVAVAPDVEPGWADAAARALERAGVAPAVVQATDSKLAMLGLVAAGLGLSVGSASMARLARHGVAFRPLDGLDLELPLELVAPARLTPRAARFAELLAG